MADTERARAAPVIVKRVKKAEHAHHGGAWKVAYADFVTAMMAFFLLLWLLASTDRETRDGLADYFTPTASLSDSESGAGGILGGLTVGQPGSQATPSAPLAVTQSFPGRPEHAAESAALEEGRVEDGEAEPAPATTVELPPGEAAEQAEFAAVEAELANALQATPRLAELARHVRIDRTGEGLRIQLLDRDGDAMFPGGSARMYDQTRQLLHMVAHAIGDLPHRISLRGHTDSVPFSGGDYGNWELSSDRAHASRRVLIEAGIDPARLASVIGLADTELLLPQAPEDPRNRRISILLMTRAGDSGAD